MKTLIVAAAAACGAFFLAAYNKPGEVEKAQETYIIISAQTTAELERLVTQKLRERYDTEGGVTFGNGKFHQAMSNDH